MRNSGEIESAIKLFGPKLNLWFAPAETQYDPRPAGSKNRKPFFFSFFLSSFGFFSLFSFFVLEPMEVFVGKVSGLWGETFSSLLPAKWV